VENLISSKFIAKLGPKASGKLLPLGTGKISREFVSSFGRAINHLSQAKASHSLRHFVPAVESRFRA
jgi:hypothetical protein